MNLRELMPLMAEAEFGTMNRSFRSSADLAQW